MEDSTKQRIKEYFENHAHAHDVHVTSDGNLFIEAHFAEAYAANLPDKKVQSIKREEEIYGLENLHVGIDEPAAPAGENGDGSGENSTNNTKENVNPDNKESTQASDEPSVPEETKSEAEPEAEASPASKKNGKKSKPTAE